MRLDEVSTLVRLRQRTTLDSSSRRIIKHAKKELGQYPAILTSRLVNNLYIFRALLGPNKVKWSNNGIIIINTGDRPQHRDLHALLFACKVCGFFYVPQRWPFEGL